MTGLVVEPKPKLFKKKFPEVTGYKISEIPKKSNKKALYQTFNKAISLK